MAQRFKGSLEQLHTLLTSAGIDGAWADDGKGKHSFRSKEDGILNWWPSSGTIQLQGQDEAKDVLEQAISAGIAAPVPKAMHAATSHQIFIVHGHDTEAGDQL